MTEPDELYTLRAQYWLGHYTLAVDEAKASARRPMSAALKGEREEFLYRAQIALGETDKVIAAAGSAGSDRPALQAIGLAAQYHSASPDAKGPIAEEMKKFIGTPGQLIAAQILLDSGNTKDALHCVHLGQSMEQLALALQIYIKIDRNDLAQESLRQLKQMDEDAVLTQLGQVYVSLAAGSSSAGDAIHTLNSLMEQYGPSPMLLNLMACAKISQGDYAGAEKRLMECITEFPDLMITDTLVNMIVCTQQQGKPTTKWVTEMKTRYPHHPFCAGLDRVVTALEREVLKYKV